MPYIEGRVAHDADSHIFEPPGYAQQYADPGVRETLDEALRPFDRGRDALFERAVAKQSDPEFRAKDADEVMTRKNFVAIGAVLRDDRPKALDLLGVASQLVFTTSYLGALTAFDRGDNVDLAYALATAHNRGMVDFCAVDPRLLPVCYVPFTDVDRAAACASEAIEMGAAALLMASNPPRAHSPSHIGFDQVWAQAQDAGLPIVFHVGGEKRMDPVYRENGLPPVPDFHGGDDNFTSVSFMAIPYSVMQTLGTLIIDGVLERFPRLKFGVIELGASWVPGWMRSMDSAAEAFRKNEERLQKLSLTPSEYVRRQVRVAPYPHEPAGWIVKQCGAEVPLFSTDYPHVEGGRNPLRRFDASLAGCTDAAREAFYCDNFVDLMGRALDRVDGLVAS
jgi:predicted TIM-barrel fold metal-dependent hydrolase